MWLLDTNAWIAYLEREPNPVKTHIAERPEAQILICDVVKAELLYGAFRSSRIEQNLAKLDVLFSLVSRCLLMARRLVNMVKSVRILRDRERPLVLMICKSLLLPAPIV
jgi:predicted nucleic acid-binding protein